MRLIDGDKLIDIVTNSADLGGVWGQVLRAVKDAFIRLIRTMPNVNQEPQWIPCSERLPKKYGNYLITTGEGEVDLGSYDPDRPGSWSACDAKGFHWVRDVVAWMPLPEPHKRGEQDEWDDANT